jgi:hypothetical protein
VRRPAAKSREKVLPFFWKNKKRFELWERSSKSVQGIWLVNSVCYTTPATWYYYLFFSPFLDNTCTWMARLFGTGRPTSAIRRHLDSSNSNNIAGPAVWKSKEKNRVRGVLYTQQRRKLSWTENIRLAIVDCRRHHQWRRYKNWLTPVFYLHLIWNSSFEYCQRCRDSSIWRR